MSFRDQLWKRDCEIFLKERKKSRATYILALKFAPLAIVGPFWIASGEPGGWLFTLCGIPAYLLILKFLFAKLTLRINREGVIFEKWGVRRNVEWRRIACFCLQERGLFKFCKTREVGWIENNRRRRAQLAGGCEEFCGGADHVIEENFGLPPEEMLLVLEYGRKRWGTAFMEEEIPDLQTEQPEPLAC